MHPSSSNLPEPSDTAIAHSKALVQLIEQRLQAGPLSFAEYMQMALYEPGFGYYMAGAHKFGSQGDFVTAPEVSELFALCIAKQARAVFDSTDSVILELGAGSGRLAAGMLNALNDIPELRYHILEPSAELQQRQQATVLSVAGRAALQKISWLDRLPEQFSGYCVANEVMDAMPVELFTKQGASTMQMAVELDPECGKLGLIVRPAPESLANSVATIEREQGAAFSDGYVSEVSQLLPPWIKSLSACIEKGVVTLIDYGYGRREYYLPERVQGTLNCFYAHHSVPDPFRYPGLQDITTHVDFTLVVESASAANMELLGYTSQASFLLELGITEIAQQAQQACDTDVASLQVARELKTLTLPGEMGERFQVMGLGKGVELLPPGFAGVDLSHRL